MTVSEKIMGSLETAAAVGAVTTKDSITAYIKQLVTGLIAATARDAVVDLAATYSPWKCITKSDGAVLTGDDDLFVITGGPIRAKIVGVVTTVLVGTSNGDLQIDVTEPAGTIDLNAAPVAINADAAGTIYTNIDSTSVFTPTTGGASIIDKVAADEAFFILPVGTVIFRSSAAQTGVIAWHMTYQKLSPLSAVAVAA